MQNGVSFPENKRLKKNKNWKRPSLSLSLMRKIEHYSKEWKKFIWTWNTIWW